MLHLAGHHDLGDAFVLADLDQPAQFAERDPVAAAAARSTSGDASSLIAMATASSPCLRALSSAITGKRPLPAMMPYLHPFSL